MGNMVKSFKDLTPDLQAFAGGKGGMLSRMFQDGYPVPEGFVVLPSASVFAYISIPFPPLIGLLSAKRNSPGLPGVIFSAVPKVFDTLLLSVSYVTLYVLSGVDLVAERNVPVVVVSSAAFTGTLLTKNTVDSNTNARVVAKIFFIVYHSFINYYFYITLIRYVKTNIYLYCS